MILNSAQNRKISLFAFDLDGTLLNSSSEISEFTLLKIREAVEKGVKVTICSGRLPAMQQVYLTQLDFDGPYVACNGALVMHNGGHARANTLIYGKAIGSEPLKKLCAFVIKEKLHACIQTLEKLYFTGTRARVNNPRVRVVEKYNRLAEEHGLSKVPIGEFTSVLNGEPTPVYKAMIYAPEKEKLAKITAFLHEESEITYTFSEEGLFEIMHLGTDKGAGIKIIADYYGIPLTEVCAFGDYDNDLPLFRLVGTKVAMGNATESLKEAATFVTDTNDNDGVGKALKIMEAYLPR